MRVPWKYENPLCSQVGLDFYYPEIEDGNTNNTRIAMNICRRCPHLTECAEWGIRRERFGIWGGLTATQRKIIRRRKGIVLPREE